MQQKDSAGNLLPKNNVLDKNATPAEIWRALTVNCFNIAVSIAMAKGLEVIYDASTNSATISEPDGMDSFIFHS